MRRFLAFLRCGVVLTTAFVTVVTPALAQEKMALREGLEKCLIPFEPDGRPIVDYLKARVQNHAVVGLGESNHGSKEFLLARIALSKLLIQHFGFRNIVFEADYGQFQTLNSYIRTGEGDINRVLTSGLMYDSHEFMEFVEWIRRFNKANKNPVEFVGMDAVYPPRYIGLTAQRLDRVDKEFLKRNHFSILDLVDPKKTPTEQIAGADRLIQIIDEDRAIRSKLGRESFREIGRNLGYFKNATKRQAMKESDLARDEFMAANVVDLWKSSHKKMIVWAHESHLNKDNFHHMGKSLGAHLKDHFGKNYFAVRTDFNRGSFWGLDSDIKEVTVLPTNDGSTGTVFAETSSKPFLLDFGAGSRIPAVKAYLDREVESKYSGMIFDPDNRYTKDVLSKSFDALIFFDEITPFNLIKTSFH